MKIFLLRVSVVVLLVSSLAFSLVYYWKLSSPLEEQIKEEVEASETSLEEAPLKSCIVLQFMSYNDFISGKDTVFSTNKELAAKSSCYFLGISQQTSSCSHWRKGVVHRSFCIIQDILNFVQNLKDSAVQDIIISSFYGDESRDRKFMAASFLTESDIPDIPFHFKPNSLQLVDITLFKDRNVQIWRINPNEKERMLLQRFLCQFWDSVFDVENALTLRKIEEIDKRPSTDYFSFFIKHKQRLEKMIHSSAGLRDHLLFKLKESPPKSEIESIPLHHNTLNKCLKASLPNYQDLYDVLLRESNPNQRHGSIVGNPERLDNLVCNVKVRIHYAQDSCLMREEIYNYPAMIEPKFGCKRTSKTKLKSALFILLTESPHKDNKFPKTIKALNSSISQAMDANPDADVILFFQDKSEWINRANFENLMQSLDRIKSSLKKPDKLKKIVNTLMKPTNLSPDLLEFTTATYNCCGWTEYIKLVAWSMVEYDTLLVIDADIFFNTNGVFDDLNQCYDDYLFLNSFDARVGLQGGFYWLRPNLEIYNHMKQVIAVPHLFDSYTGWNFTGPYFSSIRADPSRIIKKKGMQSFGQDTPQGFLFYYFMAQKYLEIKDKLHSFPIKVAQLEPCVYNYRSSIGSFAPTGGLDLICGNSIVLNLKSKMKSIKIEVGHNTKMSTTKLSSLALLKRLLK